MDKLPNTNIVAPVLQCFIEGAFDCCVHCDGCLLHRSLVHGSQAYMWSVPASDTLHVFVCELKVPGRCQKFALRKDSNLFVIYDKLVMKLRSAAEFCDCTVTECQVAVSIESIS